MVDLVRNHPLVPHDIITRGYIMDSAGGYLETETNNKGKITKTEQIFNKKGRLVKVKGTDEVSKFQKFDQYGNWTVWVEELNIPIGSFNYTYTRTFEYYE